MGKKIFKLLEKLKPKFIEGGIANNHPREILGKIWKDWEAFASYAFNKSHSTCYAWIGYQTAYLKAHFPVEFLAGSMTLDIHNTDKLAIFKQDLDRLEVKVLPPDVNRSRATFRVEVLPDGSKALRYALGAIKNVGGAAMKALAMACGDD